MTDILSNNSQTAAAGPIRPMMTEPERHQMMEDGGGGTAAQHSHNQHPLLAKFKVATVPVSEEEKREPVEEPKVGSGLKSRLENIKREFYANS